MELNSGQHMIVLSGLYLALPSKDKMDGFGWGECRDLAYILRRQCQDNAQNHNDYFICEVNWETHAAECDRIFNDAEPL